MSKETFIKNQSRFDRILYNDKKQGAYYTEHENARRILNLLEFPDEEVCCLEPSIGDGAAVALATGKTEGNDNIKIFGVELNRDRYLEAKQNPYVDYLICGDFLEDVKINHKKFSFCFMNPPYGKSMLGERYEKQFVRKVDTFLKEGAVLCLVIPYYIFNEDESLATILTNRFDISSIYKFTASEFAKYKQICIVAVKKKENTPNPDMAEAVMKCILNIDSMPELPEYPLDRKVKVLTSKEKDISIFESKGIDYDQVRSIPQRSKMLDLLRAKTKIEEYSTVLGQPPQAPNRDHSMLLVVTGYSDGTMGSEEHGNVHLQRGRVTKAQTSSTKSDEDGKVVQCVRTFNKTEVVVIENDGNIRVFK